MAYPYYTPYQQNYYPQYQPQYQPQVQPVQQAQQQPQQAVSQPMYYAGRIWVNGKSEADFFPLAPNNAVDLWDRNGKTLYQKRADATGKPSMTICDIVERTETASDGISEQGDKLPTYATKEELSAVVGVVKGFDELLGSLKSDIDAMKSDMYGLTGRKKSVSKKTVEVTDDE